MYAVTVFWMSAAVSELVLTTACRAPSRAALSSSCRTMTNRPYSNRPKNSSRQAPRTRAVSTAVAPRRGRAWRSCRMGGPSTGAGSVTCRRGDGGRVILVLQRQPRRLAAELGAGAGDEVQGGPADVAEGDRDRDLQPVHLGSGGGVGAGGGQVVDRDGGVLGGNARAGEVIKDDGLHLGVRQLTGCRLPRPLAGGVVEGLADLDQPADLPQPQEQDHQEGRQDGEFHGRGGAARDGRRAAKHRRAPKQAGASRRPGAAGAAGRGPEKSGGDAEIGCCPPPSGGGRGSRQATQT